MTAQEKRIQQNLKEHDRLARLLRKDVHYFEQEKTRQIRDFIECNDDFSCREKLLVIQETLNRVL